MCYTLFWAEISDVVPYQLVCLYLEVTQNLNLVILNHPMVVSPSDFRTSRPYSVQMVLYILHPAVRCWIVSGTSLHILLGVVDQRYTGENNHENKKYILRMPVGEARDHALFMSKYDINSLNLDYIKIQSYDIEYKTHFFLNNLEGWSCFR